MTTPLETLKPTMANGSKSNVEGQFDEDLEEDETQGIAGYNNWQLIYKTEDIKDDIDIVYINLDETIKLGEVRYTLKAERAEAPLTGYQLLLIHDGPHADEIKIGEPMSYVGAYAAITDINGDGKNEAIIHCNLTESGQSYTYFSNIDDFCIMMIGYPVSVEKGYVTMEFLYEIAGTKCCRMKYAFTSDTLVQTSLYYDIIEYNKDYKYHLIKKDFGAYELIDSDGDDEYRPITIKAGSMIQLTSTNMNDKINFITDNGIRGYFNCSFSTDEMLIDGIPQYDILEYN